MNTHVPRMVRPILALSDQLMMTKVVTIFTFVYIENTFQHEQYGQIKDIALFQQRRHSTHSRTDHCMLSSCLEHVFFIILHRNGNAVSMTVLILTRDVETCLQRHSISVLLSHVWGIHKSSVDKRPVMQNFDFFVHLIISSTNSWIFDNIKTS